MAEGRLRLVNVLEAIERFFDTLLEEPSAASHLFGEEEGQRGDDLRIILPASPTADVEELAERLGWPLPADYRALLHRGARLASFVFGEGTKPVAVGTAFADARTALEGLERFRNEEQWFPPFAPSDCTPFCGVPLGVDEPRFWLAPSGVYYVDPNGSFAADSDGAYPAIAPDVSTFLEHWLEAGCFMYHGRSLFEPYGTWVEQYTPGRVRRRENLWLGYLDSVYGEQFRGIAAVD